MGNGKWNQYQSGSGDRAKNQKAADKVFELQARGANFSGTVMRAARKVKQYTATPSDIHTLQDTLGKDSVANVNTPSMIAFYGGSKYGKFDKSNAGNGLFQGRFSEDNKYKDYNMKKWAAEKAAMASTNPNAPSQSSNPNAPASRVSGQPARTGNGVFPPSYVSGPTTNATLKDVVTTPGTPAQNVTDRLSQDEKFLRSLAQKVLELEKKGKKTGSFTAKAAERVVAGTATAADVEWLKSREALNRPSKGRRSSGEGRYQSDFLRSSRDVEFYARQVSSFAGKAYGATSGDPFQAGASAVDFVKSGSRVFSKFAKSQMGAQMANKLGNALGMEAGAGAAALKGAGAMVGKANAYIQAAVVVGKLAYTGTRIAENLLGVESGEGIRTAARDLRIASMGSLDVSNFREIQLAKLRLEREKITRQGDVLPADWDNGMGAIAGKLRTRKLDKKIGTLEIEQAAKSAGMYGIDVEGANETSRARIFEDKYGKTFGSIAGGLNAAQRAIIGDDPDFEKKAQEKTKESLSIVSQLRNKMYERINQGWLEGRGSASEFDKEAHREMPSLEAWLSPQTIFVNMDNARSAARVFPMTQSMRRLRSYE